MTRDSVAGRQAVIGRRRQRFVLVALFKGGMAGVEHLERFAEEAAQYAATVKGRLSGGATPVAVAVVVSVEEGCEAWAGTPPSGRRATFPVLADLSSGRVSCPDAPADLVSLVREHVDPSMRLV